MSCSPHGFETDFNSPRFLEACHRCGLTPTELKLRSLETFAEDGLNFAVQQVRHAHFERKHDEKMRQVLKMRDKVIKEEDIKARVAAQSLGGPMTPRSKRRGQKPDTHNNLVAQERSQLERIARRQKQELEQMMAYEIKVMKQVAENQKKMLHEAKRKADAEALRKKRAKEEEERHARLSAEKAERKREKEQQQRRLIERETRACKQQADAEALREKQARKAAREAEVARERKKAKMQANTRWLFQQQQNRIKEKQKQMEKRDKERQAAIMEINRQLGEKQAIKFSEARERVQQALQNQEQLLKQQRRNFDAKQENARRKQVELDHQKQLDRQRSLQRAAERQTEIERTRQQMEQRVSDKRRRAEEQQQYISNRMSERAHNSKVESERRAQTQAKKHATRQAAYNQMLAHQQSKKDAIFRKRKEREEAVEKRAKEEKVKDMVAQEIIRLREQDRVDAIERKRKMDAYNRQCILDGIQSEAERMRKMRDERAEIIKQRLLQRDHATLEKKAMLTAFATMRKTGKLELPPGTKFKLPEGMVSLDAASCKADHGQERKTVTSTATTTTRPRTAGVSRTARGIDKAKPASSTAARPRSAHVDLAVKPASPRRNNPPAGRDKVSKPKPLFPDSPQHASKATMPQTVNSKAMLTEDVHVKKQSNKKKKSGKLQRVAALKKKVEITRREQNEYLLHVLEQEQEDKRKRETRLRKALTHKERQRLGKMFSVERTRASERIVRLTEEHETNIASKIAELNELILHIPVGEAGNS